MSSEPSSRRRRPRPSAAAVATKVVTTAVVAYGAYRLADWAYTSWWGPSDNDHSNEDEEIVFEGGYRPTALQEQLQRQRANRQRRIRRCVRESRVAWVALSGAALTPHIFVPTETRAATRQLQALRRQQATEGTANTSEDDVRLAQEGLWETVKVHSVSRLVATAYTQSLLILVLTLQVHLWGAQLYQAEEGHHEAQPAAASSRSLFSQTSSTSASSTLQAYQQQHQVVLQRTLGYFLQTGLPGLRTRVAAVVTQVLADWKVLEAASLDTTRTAVVAALHEMRVGVEEGNLPTGRRRSLWRFLVPPESMTTTTSHSEYHEEATATGFPRTTEEVLAETWDWLESPLLAEALQATLDVTFDHVVTQCLPGDESLSLAQWLPRLKKAAGHLEATEEHPLVERIQQLPSVQEIGQLCFR